MEEMEQLLSMGFPNELATQALAATGGNSTIKATEWILNSSSSFSSPPHSSKTTPTQNPNVQPKLNRFFHFQSKPSSSIDSSSTPLPKRDSAFEYRPEPQQQQQQDEVDLPHSKRAKVCQSSFSLTPKSATNFHEPLSERMRPRTVDDVVGQDHLLGHNSLLRSAIERHRLPSIIFWGPPGTGKTSIAKSIVNSFSSQSSYRFVSLSAVTSGVKDVRDAVEDAKKIKVKNKKTVLFVDEVHRFNKSQQDSFLPIIENGSIIFLGATTENPSFHLITPLLSRCRVLTLNPLKPHHVSLLLTRAIDDPDKGLAKSAGIALRVSEEAIDFIASNSDGDARVALNVLEITATTAAARVKIRQSSDPNCIRKEEEENSDGNLIMNVENGCTSFSGINVTLDDAKEAFQCKHIAYDKGGEEHYNLISALHKSMRGSDANAAIYWLARMLEGGEEPLYIARRLIRFASEDIGLADPSALNQAVSCYQACHFLGMPECNVILAQCAAYLALAPKSVSVYKAIGDAQKVVRESVGQNEGVPLHLRNAPTKLMKEIGYGKGYIYPPDHPNLAQTQSYLPPSLQGYKFLDWPAK